MVRDLNSVAAVGGSSRTVRNLFAGLLAVLLIGCEQPAGDNAPSTGDELIPPTLGTITPASPSKELTITVTGTGRALTNAVIYSDSECTLIVSSGSVDANGNFAFLANVTPDTIYDFYVRSVDGAGAKTACTNTGVRWIQDSTPPIAPISMNVTGGTPQNNNSPIVTGSTERLSTVSLYTNSTCTSAVLATGLVDMSDNFSITTSIPNDTTVTIYAQAVDIALNVSPCSTSNFVYTEDSTAPVIPSSLGISPASPSNNNSPTFSGTTEANAFVRVYTNGTCSSSVLASGTANGAGNFNIVTSFSSDTVNTLYATARDAAGNVSACSASLTYIEDSTPPARPVSLTVTGGLTQNNNMPHVTGSAEALSDINLYTNSSCTSALAGNAATSGLGTWDIQVNVSDDTTTTYYARATDLAFNVGACSTVFTTFVEDSTPPIVPASLGVTGGTPQNNNLPSVTGNTEANAYVQVFWNPTCTLLAGGTFASGTGSFSVPSSAPNDTVTTFYANALDVAGNYSACSVSNFVYTEDSTPPIVPASLSITPVGPANNNAPHYAGNTEASTLVRVYTNASCTSSVAASGSADGGGSFDITLSPADDTTTTFYSTAQDAAGNTSSCSSSLTYTEDSTPPALPTGLATVPVSPANNNNPDVTGNAESGAAVSVYTNSSCTSVVAGSIVASGGTFTIGVTAPGDQVTTFWAKAVDPSGNASGCSASNVAYTEDSTPPVIPASIGISGGSPQNNNSPSVTGITEANATVRTYTDASCAGGVAGTGASDGGGNFAVASAAPGDAVTTFYATATDTAGNTSACSVSNFSYTEDSTPPSVPASLSITPVGPANNNAPQYAGSTEADAFVRVYTNASCTSAVAASENADGSGNFDITLSPTDDTTTTFYSTAQDGVGNTSSCSSGLTYTEDSSPPALPSGLATVPVSPANNNSPDVTGNAESGATVSVYTNSSCTSAVAGSIVASGGSFTIGVTAPGDQVTTFWAKAVDPSGNASGCSTSNIAYTEDSTPPVLPTALATTPVSPANNNFPNVTGTAEAGSYIYVYTNVGCTSALAGSVTATGGGTFSANVNPSNDTTTTYYAKSVDVAGNDSGCSTSNVTYVEDSTPPATPTGLAAVPSPPANNNTPHVTGATEADATVRIYTNPSCTSAIAQTGSANGSGNFDLTLSVSDDTTTSFYAKSTDASGNASACSSGVVFIEDSTGIPPSSLASTPQGPSNNNAPNISGSGEIGATVDIYTDSSCTSAIAGSGIASAGTFSISVTVFDDTSTTFWAKLTDIAGNVSPCSTSNVTFLEDSAPPIVPSVVGTTSPVSPNKDSTPDVSGTTEASATVELFTDSGCSSAVIGTGTANGSGNWTINASVTANATTTIWATATDTAANESACSASSVSYYHDNIAPATPTGLASDPASPVDENSFDLTGSTEAGAAVNLYTNSGCTSAVLASSTANGSGDFTFPLTVSDDTTTTIYAKATDIATNDSACSSVFVNYIEDSSTPKPSGLASTPTSPSQTTAATLSGSAEANAIVRLYTNNDCTSAVVGTDTAEAGSFSIAILVADNSSVTYWAEATDALGHISGCSTESFTYTHDNSPPAMPVIGGTNPVSPSFVNTFDVTGTSEIASTIKLYTNSSCTSAVQGTGTTNGAGNFATSATVSSNSSTTFWATATDGAGNASSCSSTNVTYDEDSVLPAIPTISGTTPASPSNSNAMAVTGTAEALATIRLYTNSSCTSAVQGTGSATAGGTFSVSATASSDSSTTFWATATDAAGNVAACSSTNVTYLEDSTPPATPTIVAINPNEPSDTHVPVITGTGTANEIIKLYSDSSCTNLTFTGALDGSGNFSLAPTVLDDTTNTYYAKSFDSVGNESACTGSSVSYTNYSVAEGVAYLTGTRVVASTDIHQGAASPFQWSSHKYHSTYYSHSTTSNSHHLQVKVTGDYLIHLTMQIQTDSSTPNQIIFQIRFGDGTTQTQSSRGVCYTSMSDAAGTQATKQSSCNSTARLSLTANQIIDVTARGSRGTAPTYSSGSAMFVEYIPSTRDTYYGSSLQNTNNQTNLSFDSNQYYLKWTDFQKDAIYTHSDSTSPELIQLTQAGTYFVSVDVPMTSSTNYNNHRFKVYCGAAGSTVIPGAEFKQGYSGPGASGFSSSAHWTGILHNVDANDLLRVGHQREGNTVGTQQINSARPAVVYIEKVNASEIYIGRGSTVTGADSTNYNQDSSYLNFTTDTLIDTGTYTHSTSTDPHQITLKNPGLYKVTFSASLTTTTADASPKFNLQIDGVNYENAVTASTNIENVSSHSESSAALVYYVQTTSANKVLSVVSAVQHSVAAIVSAALSPDNDHTITVRKMSKSSSP